MSKFFRNKFIYGSFLIICLLLLSSSQHISLAEDIGGLGDISKSADVTFYLPFYPDAKTPGLDGVRISRTGKLFEDDYKNAGITVYDDAEYHPTNSQLSANERGAIDFQLPANTIVRAVADGRVIKGNVGTGTCEVAIRHDDGSTTYYLHLNESFVNVGNEVKQGDEIGLSGNRCGSAGAHLHVARWIGGKETKITFADASVKEHGGIIRPSKSTQNLLFLYKADGDIPTANEVNVSSNTPFPDVPTTDTFFDYIMALYYQGAINGYSNGNFGTYDAITRGQMAKVLVRALSEQTEYSDGVCAFPDVCSGHKFYHDIRRIKELGITSGYSDGEYKPDNELTRGAMAKFVVIARDGKEPSYSSCSQPFPDVSCSDTFYPHIRRLKEIFDDKGVSLGYNNGTFGADDTLSRGGATKFTVIGLDLEFWIPPFPDVLPDNISYRYIKTMKDRGITDGFSDGEYKPDRDITRGETSKFVARGMGFYSDYTDNRQSFPDVPSSHKFYQFIEYLKENDIASGYSNGNFGPDDNITRGQIAKIIVRGLATQGITCEDNSTPYFPDVPTDYTFYNEIQCLKELGIVNGYSDGEYKPDLPITRGQTAKIIVLAFVDITPEVEQEPSEATNDSYTTAPVQELHDPDAEELEYGTDVNEVGTVVNYVVPDGDVDWFQANVEEGEEYKLETQDTDLNAELEIVVAKSSKSASAGQFIQQVALETMALEDNEISMTWKAEQTGVYYVRIRNTKDFAQEGVSTNVSVEHVQNTPPPSTVYPVYLPIVIK